MATGLVVRRAPGYAKKAMRISPLGILPKGALVILKEALRHILRRPVVGICAAARTDDGRWLLIRRADTGTWALPGGTLEWGETLRDGLRREMEEEAGVLSCEVQRVVGVYSKPERDPRFHAVTIVVACVIAAPTKAPSNPLEILEARLFAESELPRDMAMGMRDFLDDARAARDAVLE